MKHRTTLSSLLAIASSALLAASVSAAPEATKPAAKPAAATKAAKPAADAKAAMDPAMEAWMKAAAPGKMHEHLKAFEGTWNTTVKSMMDPTKPPEMSKGRSVKKMIMGGRYLSEDAAGQMGAMPFQGMGITGYDNLKGKYVGTWIDNMGTGVMMSFGEGDGKTFTSTAEYDDPMTGKPAKSRMVTKVLSPDKHVFEMYGPGPDGKEFQMLEITYERVK